MSRPFASSPSAAATSKTPPTPASTDVAVMRAATMRAAGFSSSCEALGAGLALPAIDVDDRSAAVAAAMAAGVAPPGRSSALGV
jgi:hypothetical protein